MKSISLEDINLYSVEEGIYYLKVKSTQKIKFFKEIVDCNVKRFTIDSSDVNLRGEYKLLSIYPTKKEIYVKVKRLNIGKCRRIEIDKEKLIANTASMIDIPSPINNPVISIETPFTFSSYFSTSSGGLFYENKTPFQFYFAHGIDDYFGKNYVITNFHPLDKSDKRVIMNNCANIIAYKNSEMTFLKVGAHEKYIDLNSLVEGKLRVSSYKLADCILVESEKELKKIYEAFFGHRLMLDYSSCSMNFETIMYIETILNLLLSDKIKLAKEINGLQTDIDVVTVDIKGEGPTNRELIKLLTDMFKLHLGSTAYVNFHEKVGDSLISKIIAFELYEEKLNDENITNSSMIDIDNIRISIPKEGKILNNLEIINLMSAKIDKITNEELDIFNNMSNLSYNIDKYTNLLFTDLPYSRSYGKKEDVSKDDKR